MLNTTNWKIFKEMGIPDHLTCLLRNLYLGQEATVQTRHGTLDWFKLGKEYVKTVYCHPAYLTYMQRISYEMWGWMNHKLESRLSGKISNFRYASPCLFNLYAEYIMRNTGLDAAQAGIKIGEKYQ